MRIIFAGTPEFSLPTLQALKSHDAYQIVAVYTQPDRPAGRGQKLTSTPVKLWALANGLQVYTPSTLKTIEEQEKLRELQADLIIVIAYGLILPTAVLKIPRLGCINVHASLLPRWRGAAPIQHAILANDSKTGVTIMQMDAGLDTGMIMEQASLNIAADDTSCSLHYKLAILGAKTLLTTLENLPNIIPYPQDNNLACYAAKITKQQAQLDWHLAAYQLALIVRAFNPWPVAFAQLHHNLVRIWQAEPMAQESQEAPGTVIKVGKAGIDVATAKGVLRLLRLQLPSGKILTAQEFINAHSKLLEQ